MTADEKDSAALAMNSGCDLDAGRFYKHLVDAVHRGKVSQQRLDEAVTNLLATRIRLGILGEHAENFDEIPYTVVDSPEMVALNRAVSLQCPVLLKNDGILPLDPAKKQTLAVIGPNANSRAALVGNYEARPRVMSRCWKESKTPSARTPACCMRRVATCIRTAPAVWRRLMTASARQRRSALPPM